jgi:hypothetical protein
MASEPSEVIYTSLSSFSDIQALIDGAEAEGLYLECKAPASPRLSREQKVALAKAVSGFANTSGGVILWGVSTTKHAHSDLDVLTQIEPIGNIGTFSRLVSNVIPTLTTPALTAASHRILRERQPDTRGILITYIPQVPSAPLQSNLDSLFYFRSGDEFVVAPYELVRRLFASSEAPDLHLVLAPALVKKRDDGSWLIPLAIQNRSSAIAEHVKLFLEVHNPDACETITASGLQDASDVNPGRTVFAGEVSGVVHRGLNEFLGSLVVRMRTAKRAKRILRISVSLYANRMRAIKDSFTIQLAKKGFSVRQTTSEPEY